MSRTKGYANEQFSYSFILWVCCIAKGLCLWELLRSRKIVPVLLPVNDANDFRICHESPKRSPPTRMQKLFRWNSTHFTMFNLELLCLSLCVRVCALRIDNSGVVLVRWRASFTFLTIIPANMNKAHNGQTVCQISFFCTADEAQIKMNALSYFSQLNMLREEWKNGKPSILTNTRLRRLLFCSWTH